MIFRHFQTFSFPKFLRRQNGPNEAPAGETSVDRDDFRKRDILAVIRNPEALAKFSATSPRMQSIIETGERNLNIWRNKYGISREEWDSTITADQEKFNETIIKAQSHREKIDPVAVFTEGIMISFMQQGKISEAQKEIAGSELKQFYEEFFEAYLAVDEELKTADIRTARQASMERARSAGGDEARKEALKRYAAIVLISISDERVKDHFIQTLDALGEQFTIGLEQWQKTYGREIQEAAKRSGQEFSFSTDEIIDRAEAASVNYVKDELNVTALQAQITRDLDELIQAGKLPPLSEQAKDELAKVILDYFSHVRKAVETAIHEEKVASFSLEEQAILGEYRDAITMTREGKFEIDTAKLEASLKAKPKEEQVKARRTLEAMKGKYEGQSGVGDAIKKSGFMAALMDMLEKLAAWLKELTASLGIKDKKKKETPEETAADQPPERAAASPLEGKLKITGWPGESSAGGVGMLAETEAGKTLKAPVKGKVVRTGESPDYGGAYIVFEVESGGRKLFFGGVNKDALPDTGKTLDAGENLAQTGTSLIVQVTDQNGKFENPLSFFQGHYERAPKYAEEEPQIDTLTNLYGNQIEKPAWFPS